MLLCFETQHCCPSLDLQHCVLTLNEILKPPQQTITNPTLSHPTLDRMLKDVCVPLAYSGRHCPSQVLQHRSGWLWEVATFHNTVYVNTIDLLLLGTDLFIKCDSWEGTQVHISVGEKREKGFWRGQWHVKEACLPPF